MKADVAYRRPLAELRVENLRRAPRNSLRTISTSETSPQELTCLGAGLKLPYQLKQDSKDSWGGGMPHSSKDLRLPGFWERADACSQSETHISVAINPGLVCAC